MPGLFGSISVNGEPVDAAVARAMCDMLRRRSDYRVDDAGIRPDADARGIAAIGRVHLGLVNPQPQPFTARGGRVQVFLHGEIYNDEATHANPLEFIYRSYEKHGAGFVTFLHGSFIVIIVDAEAGVTLIATDRLATRPLFYYCDGRAFHFGPEMKALLPLPSLTRELDWAAVADFLANGQFTSGHTWLKGVQRLERATLLRITSRGIEQHRYWEFALEQDERDRGAAYYREELMALLRQAVQRCLRRDHRYGVLLSGGYDSRTILGCYLETARRQELHTISWGRAEDVPGGDCGIAQKLAQALGAEHRFYRLTAEEVVERFREWIWLGEGMTWFPESYQVFRRIRDQQGVEIVLRGDECFGYSHWLTVHDEHTMFRVLDLRTLRNIPAYRQVLNPRYRRLLCELDDENIRRRSARCRETELHNRKDYFYLDVRMQYYLNPLNAAKRLFLESFTPLLDYDLLDFVSRLPSRYRLGRCLYQQTVVEMFPQLFDETAWPIAQVQDTIDWDIAFPQTPALQRFARRELLEEPGILVEFADLEGVRGLLDAHFQGTGAPSAWSQTSAWLSTTLPPLYRLLHSGLYRAKRWSGQVRDMLSPARIVWHLLIVKAWAELFL